MDSRNARPEQGFSNVSRQPEQCNLYNLIRGTKITLLSQSVSRLEEHPSEQSYNAQQRLW